MEAHFVHYNSRYENFTEAMEQPDGIAVFAVFFEVSSQTFFVFQIIMA